MPTLLRDAYVVLERYAAPAFVRLARTAESFATHDQVVSSSQACRAALQRFDHSELGILLDWRLAPATFEVDALERAMLSEAESLATVFARRAILLLPAAHSDAAPQAWSSVNVQTFHDEEAAIAYASVR